MSIQLCTSHYMLAASLDSLPLLLASGSTDSSGQHTLHTMLYRSSGGGSMETTVKFWKAKRRALQQPSIRCSRASFFWTVKDTTNFAGVESHVSSTSSCLTASTAT